MTRVSVEQFYEVLSRAVKEYTDDVTNGIMNEVDDTAGKVLKETRKLAPKRTGEYAKGFTKTLNKKVLATHGYREYTVWNRKHYRRVHLLEFPHAVRGGGRSRAFPHLQPAYDKYAENMPKRIETIIRRGG